MCAQVDVGPVHNILLSSYADYTVGSAQYNWLLNDLLSIDRTKTPWWGPLPICCAPLLDPPESSKYKLLSHLYPVLQDSIACCNTVLTAESTFPCLKGLLHVILKIHIRGLAQKGFEVTSGLPQTVH